MHRRDLLRRLALGGTTALAASGTPATKADAKASEPANVEHYRGWTIRWRPWQTPINQLVTFGVWWAENPNAPASEVYGKPITLYCTTLGSRGTLSHPTCQFEVYREKNWPIVVDIPSKEAIAARALALATVQTMIDEVTPADAP